MALTCAAWALAPCALAEAQLSPARVELTAPAAEAPSPRAPASIVYERRPAPAPATEVRQRINWKVVAPGIGLLAGGWLGYWGVYLVGSIGCVSGGCNPDYGSQLLGSLIPIVGPWLNIGMNDAEPLWPAAMGLLQLTGLTMLIIGLMTPDELPVQVDVSPSPYGGAMLRATVRAM